MEDVSSRIVKKAIGLGCQDAIADVITNRSYQIRFAQNETVIGNRWREATASVFFVYDKRVLASDIKDLTQLDAAVDRLVTSSGVEAHDHRASPYLSIPALVSLESSGHGIACATKFSQFNPEKAGRKAGRIAALARSPKPGKAGRYTVVFDPLIFGSLMDQTGGRLGAWTVMAGLCPFGKKIGKKVASLHRTLSYDGS